MTALYLKAQFKGGEKAGREQQKRQKEQKQGQK